MSTTTAATTNTALLFACSRCFSRHPFEELSPGQQLCKECRGTFPVVKCTYCRSEFQQTSKSTSSICKKCEANVKAYGKPTACEYCNIIAAFIGNKCQRCTNSEKKYGPAVSCDQCKQRCAFDCPDEDKRVDGKLLCWLCSLSLKRALAKTKQHLNNSMDSKLKHRSHKLKSGHKDRHKERRGSRGDKHAPPEKRSKMNPLHGEVDPNSSDHMVAVTHLKETIASMQKSIGMKDQQLLNKDKLITELKAQHFTAETELRTQMKSTEKAHELKVNLMNTKIQGLLKEVASLSRSVKKNTGKKSTVVDNHSSGTDSPSTN